MCSVSHIADQSYVQVREMEVDASCPQQHDFEIVRCTGHQHIGARCITLFNAETNETICRSCPVLGTQQGARLPNSESCVIFSKASLKLCSTACIEKKICMGLRCCG